MLKLLSYPRSVVATLFNVLLTFVMCFVMLFLALVVRKRKVVDWAIVNLWCRPMLRPSGIELELRGDELVRETKRGFLILFNHSSLIDIPVLYGGFPRSFRFGAKVELFKIPFFGKAMEACGVLPIDRRNRGDVMKVYESAIARIERGECFALAPEGTRQGGAQLGKFKRGPFEFAINAQMDVVPVVIAGALRVLPKNRYWINMGRWKQKVIMQITPPIASAGLSLEQVDVLQDKVRAQMEPLFNQLNAELGGF